jgi:hypothetical protein
MFRFSFALLAYLIASGTSAQAEDRIWAISATGGVSPDETHYGMYLDSQAADHFFQDIKPTYTYELFGRISKNNSPLSCYANPGFVSSLPPDPPELTAAEKTITDGGFKSCPKEASNTVLNLTGQQILDYYNAKVKVPVTCNRQLTSQEQAKLGSTITVTVQPGLEKQTTNPNETDLPAQTGTFLTSLAKIKTQIQTAKTANPETSDEVFISMSDHGSTDDSTGAHPTQWRVYFNGIDDYITDADLQKALKSLSDDHIRVHLDVDACFSGGFNHLTKADSDLNSVCVLTSSDSNTVGVDPVSASNDPNAMTLARAMSSYGNQLQAEACYLAGSKLNVPQSSLDQIAQNWRAGNPTGVPQCPPDASLKDVETQFEDLNSTVAGNSPEKERGDLMNAYRNSFLKTVESCTGVQKNTGDFSDQIDNAAGFGAWARACVQQGVIANNPRVQAAMMLFGTVKKIESHIEINYAAQVVGNHLQFLKNAPIDKIREFKRAFCCLSYNFKTHSTPEICNAK